MTNQAHTYAVILAGGGGTRLWPKSRSQTPKQFLKLVGNKTMMRLSAERINKIVPWEKIIVVTNKLYLKEVQTELPEIPETNIIAEPEKKDTAIAMLVGSLFAKNLDPEAVILNAASDHIVVNEKEFIRVMQAAASTAADSDYLVTVGITPSSPSSAFGYIKIDTDLKKLGRGLSLFKVKNFTEKPNPSTARAFISTGKYFWNANMYVWSVKTIEKAFAHHQPETFQLSSKLTGLSPSEFHQALTNIYQKVEAISIDYAISEKADNLVLIPGDFGWDDIGEWKVVYDLGKKDSTGNVVIGNGQASEDKYLALKSRNNLLHLNERFVAMIGVNDMIIVDTEEILMIAPMSHSQEVKKIVETLKTQNKKQYL